MRAFILSVVLFLSGMSALLFQTLWLRLSGLTFGNSVWSAALILSSFMAGLAVGSIIASSPTWLQRFRPLRVYAVMELVIALTGCTIVFGLPVLGDWLRPVFQALWEHDSALNLLRLVFSFAILLVPTTAMGLTMAVLVEDPVLKDYEFGSLAGFFYGANTLGAVAGAIIGEAILIRLVGIWGSSVVSAGLNCAAAVAAVALGKVTTVPGAETAPSRQNHLGFAVRQLPWAVLFVSFATGALLLCLEVVWFRFLRLYVASSSIAFAIMLAVVLGGIGLGGLVSGAARRYSARFERTLPVLLVIAGTMTLLSYIFFPLPTLKDRIANYFFESWNEIAIPSLFLMFPVAFLSGIVFPAMIAVVQNTVTSRMNSVGLTTLVNTFGATLGPIIASFVLLPALGFQSTLILCAIGYVASGLILTKWRVSVPFVKANAATLVILILFAVVLLLFPYGRDEKHFANARRSYEAIGERLVKKVEGNSETYQLLRRDIYGEPYYYRLAANAFSLASTDARNQRYMRLFAYLPLFFGVHSKEALLICYGCGVTADALVHSPGLEHVDIVDISKEVFQLAPLYVGKNEPDALRDPRVKTFVQDGRFFLQASPKKYDIITGEPPPPKVAGTVNLYTEEFFALMHERLNDGGIVSFWLPVAELKAAEAKSILRAFHNVFPVASVWASGDDEWIMVGIKGAGNPLSETDVRRLWENPATANDLVRIGIETPQQLASFYLMDGEEIDRLTSESSPLTDWFPKRLSDAPPDMENVRQMVWNYMEAGPALSAFRSSKMMKRLWPDTMKSGLQSFFVVREARYLSGTALHGSNKLAELDLYLRNSKLRTPVLESLRTDEFRLAIARTKADDQKMLSPELIPDFVADALAERDFPRAIQLLEQKKQGGAAVPNDLYLLIYLNCLTGHVDAAETLAATMGASRTDWFVDWLWGKLQAEYGFRPPS